MEGLEEHGYFNSITYTPLWNGADGAMVLGAGIVYIIIALCWMSFSWLFLGVLFVCIAAWVGTVKLLQYAAEHDPMLRLVYLRHITYQRFYPAGAGIHSKAKPTPARWV